MAYTRVNWKDYPSTDTPITAANLNKMDEAIDDMYDIVSNCPVGVDTIATTTAVPRDADTLGGRYDADDIEDLSDSLVKTAKAIDFSKILIETTTLTAGTEVRLDITEDCYVRVGVYGSQSLSGYARINGNPESAFCDAYCIGSVTTSSTAISPMLSNGDYILMKSSTYNGTYTVYGVK